MSSPARLVLGVDAGGTKTDAALADATTGEVVTTVRLGAANHEGIGWAAAADTMRTAVTTVCAAADVPATAITASAWGLSGLDWPEDGTRYREIVDSLGLAGPALVVNDAFLCLELAPAGPAVAVVAGTGVVAVARDGAGRTARTLGVGAGHGEWGSGGDVVRAAVEAVAQALPRPRTRHEPDRRRPGRLGRCGRRRVLPPGVAGAPAVPDARRRVGRGGPGDRAGSCDRGRGPPTRTPRPPPAWSAGSTSTRPPTVLVAGRVLDPGHDLLHAALLAAFADRLPGAAVRRLGVAPVHGAVQAAVRLVRNPAS